MVIAYQTFETDKLIILGFSFPAAEPNSGNQGNHQEKSQQIAKPSGKRNQNPQGKKCFLFHLPMQISSVDKADFVVSPWNIGTDQSGTLSKVRSKFDTVNPFFFLWV